MAFSLNGQMQETQRPATATIQTAEKTWKRDMNNGKDEEPYNHYHSQNHQQHRPRTSVPPGYKLFNIRRTRIQTTGAPIIEEQAERDENRSWFSNQSARNMQNRSKPSEPYFVPGYTGYIRGKQHIAGTTYGNTTRKALTTPYETIVTNSPIPADPQANSSIPQKRFDHTFVSKYFTDRQYHLPQYTGFVPGIRTTYGKTYGTATTEQFEKNQQLHGRTQELEISRSRGFATTSYAPRRLILDANPLPGGSPPNEVPRLYVPQHIAHLKYLAQ